MLIQVSWRFRGLSPDAVGVGRVRIDLSPDKRCVCAGLIMQAPLDCVASGRSSQTMHVQRSQAARKMHRITTKHTRRSGKPSGLNSGEESSLPHGMGRGGGVRTEYGLHVVHSRAAGALSSSDSISTTTSKHSPISSENRRQKERPVRARSSNCQVPAEKPYGAKERRESSGTFAPCLGPELLHRVSMRFSSAPSRHPSPRVWLAVDV